MVLESAFRASNPAISVSRRERWCFNGVQFAMAGQKRNSEKERDEVLMRKLKMPPKLHKAAGKPATRVKEGAKLASSTEKK
jgi:hypothetical protein